MVKKQSSLEFISEDQTTSDTMAEFNWTPDELQEIVDGNPLVLFMKGTPQQPMCGFSNRAAMVLQQIGEPFVSVDVLSDPKAIPSVCEWADFPTMPQIYVHGELIGGSDIALEMFQSGELQQMLQAGES
ncbi:MAG TPA: Grx4 family monothiol glutaredoxin [Candidatus Thalassarchaeaceae archaeon]|nr:Grx4 family monothiol glutaredoxin [Candidatus Thalassarchaeaceae archaeon]